MGNGKGGIQRRRGDFRGASLTFATYEKSGRVATITLNRPESRNAIATQEDCDDLAGALWKANDDEGVNAVILTGAGKSF